MNLRPVLLVELQTRATTFAFRVPADGLAGARLSDLRVALGALPELNGETYSFEHEGRRITRRSEGGFAITDLAGPQLQRVIRAVEADAEPASPPPARTVLAELLGSAGEWDALGTLRALGFPHTLDLDHAPVGVSVVSLDDVAIPAGPGAWSGPVVLRNDHRIDAHSELFLSERAARRYAGGHPAEPEPILFEGSAAFHFVYRHTFRMAEVRVQREHLRLDPHYAEALAQAIDGGSKADLLEILASSGMYVPLVVYLGGRVCLRTSGDGPPAERADALERLATLAQGVTARFLRGGQSDSTFLLDLCGGAEEQAGDGERWLASLDTSTWQIVGTGETVSVIELLPDEALRARGRALLARTSICDLGVDIRIPWRGLPATPLALTSGARAGWLVSTPEHGLFLTDEGRLALVDARGDCVWHTRPARPGAAASLVAAPGRWDVVHVDRAGQTLRITSLPLPAETLRTPAGRAYAEAEASFEEAGRALEASRLGLEALRTLVDGLQSVEDAVARSRTDEGYALAAADPAGFAAGLGQEVFDFALVLQDAAVAQAEQLRTAAVRMAAELALAGAEQARELAEAAERTARPGRLLACVCHHVLYHLNQTTPSNSSDFTPTFFNTPLLLSFATWLGHGRQGCRFVAIAPRHRSSCSCELTDLQGAIKALGHTMEWGTSAKTLADIGDCDALWVWCKEVLENPEGPPADRALKITPDVDPQVLWDYVLSGGSLVLLGDFFGSERCANLAEWQALTAQLGITRGVCGDHVITRGSTTGPGSALYSYVTLRTTGEDGYTSTGHPLLAAVPALHFRTNLRAIGPARPGTDVILADADGNGPMAVAELGPAAALRNRPPGADDALVGVLSALDAMTAQITRDTAERQAGAARMALAEATRVEQELVERATAARREADGVAQALSARREAEAARLQEAEARLSAAALLSTEREQALDEVGARFVPSQLFLRPDGALGTTVNGVAATWARPPRA